MASAPSDSAKTRLLREFSCPVGSGRLRVRAIRASTPESTTWLMAAAEAAARPMPSVPKTSAPSGTMPGVARNIPTMAVNTISATTLSLHSAR